MTSDIVDVYQLRDEKWILTEKLEEIYKHEPGDQYEHQVDKSYRGIKQL